jgi:adenine-specific DNA-methyltransferase
MPLLHWLTRDDDIHAATRTVYRLLVEVQELSHGDCNASNMLIHGDNLEALKALLVYYAGKVKCIVIDPPYNTRSAFEHYDDNLEHTKWLAMMYPRLELLREFLTEDGCIWVTIDDNEVHYLKVIMDEVFGRKNFLTTFIWKKAYGGGAKSKWFVGLHEYVHCYAKNIKAFPDMFLSPDPEAESKYYKLFDEKKVTRGPFRVKPLEATKSMDRRENLVYPIPTPEGTGKYGQKDNGGGRKNARMKPLNTMKYILQKGKTVRGQCNTSNILEIMMGMKGKENQHL